MIRIILAVLAAAALFMIIVMVIDNHRFVVRNYTVRSPKILLPLKIVFIADLHEKDFGTDNEKLVARIREERPDVILIGGDLIVSGQVGKVRRKAERARGQGADGGIDPSWMKNSLTLVKNLVQICPVWFVQGNHEIRLEYYEELNEYNVIFREEMKKAGVRFIENGRTGPYELCNDKDYGVNLHGLVLPVRYYKKFTKNELPSDELENLIGKAVVAVSEDFYRPTDVVNLWGDPTKAKAKLKWNPNKTSFEELVKLMVKSDMAKVASEDAAMKVRTNLAEYLEKGIVK